MLKVNVKWGKQKYDNIEINIMEPPIVFKSQLYTLTGVPPERQKILVKGGSLKDDANWSELGIKDGHTFMMMGTTEKDIEQDKKEKQTLATQKPVFVEDLSQDEQTSLESFKYPAGLTNLGNTCYMNATLQTLKKVEELQFGLQKYTGSIREGDNANNVTVALKDLFKNLTKSNNQPIAPLVFLQVLRTAFPQFAQKGNHGEWMQQDAEECYTQLLLSLSQKVPKIDSSSSSAPSVNISNSIVTQLFSGELSTQYTNTEDASENKTEKTESFMKLSCHIKGTTNFLNEGLKDSLEEEISKFSEKQNREAKYKKQSKISKLPFYLTVQFVRFFWKTQNQVKAKIVRPVEFPLVLDMYEYCTDDLKSKLSPKRKSMIEAQEKKLEESKKLGKGEGKQEETKSNQTQTQAQDISDPSSFVNETGMYELVSVVSHKGRMADGGHYVAWVRDKGDKWLKYDDDKVSEVDSEEIKKLSGKGGGDWHMAYLLLYKSIN